MLGTGEQTMELKRDEIIKALERDIRISIDLNYECPRITYSKLRDALALIKELTKEVESLEHERASFMETFGEWSDKCEKLASELRNKEIEIKDLTEELAEANKLLNMHRFLASDNGTTYVIPSVRSIQAEVVKQMQGRLAKHFLNDDNLNYIEVDADYINECIDKIAKKMQDQEVDNGREKAKC
jgi:hypothetical protein